MCGGGIEMHSCQLTLFIRWSFLTNPEAWDWTPSFRSNRGLVSVHSQYADLECHDLIRDFHAQRDLQVFLKTLDQHAMDAAALSTIISMFLGGRSALRKVG